MNLLKAIEDFQKSNPAGAAIILGGIAAFLAVATVSTSIDLNSRWPSVLLLLAIGGLVIVAGAMLAFPLVRILLGSFLIVFGILWVIGFGYTRLDQGNQQISCLVFFWQPCIQTADNSADIAQPPLPQIPKDPLPPTTIGVQPGDYRVFVQFAGALTRDRVRQFMQSLANGKWGVQGVAGGGERIASAAGLSEVRYGPSSDKAAAEQLAQQATQLQLLPQSRTFIAKQFSAIPAHTLELWAGL